MAIIGMDIDRSFAQAAFLQDGQVKREQRVDLVHDRLVNYGESLSVEDEVVIEATGNSAAVERILRPFVKRVVVAISANRWAIAYARVKTDKIDAVILATSRRRLSTGGLGCDDNTQRQRRQTVERMGVLRAGRPHQGTYSRDPACKSDPEVLGPSVRQGRQEMAGWPAVA